MPEPKSIETGVDKLVDIVNRRKRVSLPDAAKELGVSVPVVQEWANFLEDEGLISVEDHLSTTFLSERKLSKGEVEKKTREYGSKKDAFIAKVETAISSLQKESEGLIKVKEEFEKLKTAIGGDIDLVKEELSELKHYEELKKNMDKEILQQRLDYQAMLDGVKKKISEEQKRYASFLESIGNEKSAIEEARVELSFLERKEENLQKRMDSLQEVFRSLQQELDKQREAISEALQNIEAKVKDSERLRTEMRSRIDLEVTPITKKIKDNEERILAVQNAVLQKIMAKHKELDNYKLKSTETADKLKSFFERRANIQGLIESIDKDRTDIEKDLKGLVKKAQAFNLSTRSSDTKKFVKELEGSLKDVEKKKLGMKGKLEKLTALLNKKE